MLLLICLICGPIVNGLEAAYEMDVLFRDFLLTGMHPANFCFS